MIGAGGSAQTDPKFAVVKCLICEKSIESQNTFTCKRCRKASLCFDHLDREFRLCSGCAAEERIRVYNNLIGQERSLRGFLRFTQFVFVLALLLFALDRFFYEYAPDFLKTNVFFERDLYLYFGAAAAVGMAFCYALIIPQKQKMKEIKEKIQRHKTDSRYMFR